MVSEGLFAQVRRIARAAGREIMAHYGAADAGVSTKADNSPLTAADLAAHRTIMDGLRAGIPGGYPIVSEEGDLPPYEARAAWTRWWLVDPLDGTKEFLQRNGEFTVNIALMENGVPTLGVVFAPAINVEYSAALGLGSWIHEAGREPRRLFGPSRPGPEGLTIVESRSHPSAALEAWLGTVKVAKRVQAGSSLKFGVVAEGRAHCYPRFGPTHDWDVAAGDCVWRNAVASGQRASSIVYNTPELLNPGFVIGVIS